MNTGPRVAVIGCGYWGRNLVRNFAELGALAAVSDSDRGVSERAAAECGVHTLPVEDALSAREVDAVVIAAPAIHHYELAAKALAAGKHVFVEKPLALNLSDAESLCAQARASGQVLMVGHLLQYHPAFLTVKALVDDGALGRVQYLYSNRLNLGRIRREEDTLWSFAPHDISMILSLVNSEPDSVTAVAAPYLHKTIADVTTTHMWFPGGERAHVFVSWLHPFKEQKLVVVGDRAMAVFDDGEPWSRKVQVFQHRIDWREGLPEVTKAAAEPIPLDAVEPLRVECEHFLDCVATGAAPHTDGYEGLRVLRVLRAASDSMASPPARVAGPERRHSAAFIHETAYVDDDCEVGSGTRVWHFCHVQRGSRIGRDCVLGQNVTVGPGVTIGDRCKLQNNVSVFAGVTLGDAVFCGPSCVFTNVLNPRADVERKDEFRATPVGRGATIGANATIVCGNRIGPYAMIGAGAVVTADVPAHGLFVGVPARHIGWVSHAGERLDADLVCPRTGRRYEEVNGELRERTR